MSPAAFEAIAAAVECQAVLELVAQRLAADKPIDDEVQLTLLAAVRAAIGRLDRLYEVFDGAAAVGSGVLQ